MKFYESIAPYYDLIFDPEDSAGIVNEKYLKGRPGRIIDIGCATGKLSADLAGFKHFVTAVDLDEKMIGIAAGKYAQKGLDLKFMCVNMLDIADVFEPASFDAAVCLGNTIVHLDGPGRILEFFAALNRILKPGAVFVAQILNYDRILSQKIDKLALIENDEVRFERYYDLDIVKNGGKLSFITKLTVKSTGAVIENETPLYPAGKQEIADALNAAGFTGVNFYSDIDGAPFLPGNSGPLAFCAVK